MVDKIIINNVNEAYVSISCDEGIAYELREAFTFQVPVINSPHNIKLDCGMAKLGYLILDQDDFIED